MGQDKVECPHCGYVYRTDVKEEFEHGRTHAVKGLNEKIPKSEKEMRVDQTCPYCGKVFEWPVK